MRLRGGVEFEELDDAAAADAADVEALQKAVDRLKQDAGFLHVPEMSFFRDYLTSLGATLPRKVRISQSADSAPAAAAGGAAAEEEEGESEEEDAEDMDDAEIIPESAADIDPPQTPADVSRQPSDEDFEKVAELKGQAMEAAAAGETEKAIDLWTQCITLAPSANLVCGRAMCYISLKKPLAAIRDADNALEINSDSAKAFKTRGRALAMLGRWVEAVKDLGTGQGIDYDDDTASFQSSIKEKADRIIKREARQRAKDLKKRQKEQEAELARRKEEAIKRRQKEVEEENERERAAAAAGGMGGGPGGMGGMPGGMGGMGIPPGMEKLFSDPDIMAGMQNPKVL